MNERRLRYDIESIGTVAGYIWQDLNQNGPKALGRLARDIDAPRDLVMQGLGWLAREGKVKFEQRSRGCWVSLT